MLTGILDKQGSGWFLTMLDENDRPIIVFYFDELQWGENFLKEMEEAYKQVEQEQKEELKDEK